MSDNNNMRIDKRLTELAQNAGGQWASLSGDISKILVDEDDQLAQQRLAGLLRHLTASHLAHGDTAFAINFREQYQALFTAGATKQSLAAYIEAYAKPASWARDTHAAALADLLNITVIITPINKGVEQTSMILQENWDTSRPIIRLYNSNNVHWHIDRHHGKNTIGNGDCLFNAFAQCLRQITILERVYTSNKKCSIDISDIEHTFAENNALAADIAERKRMDDLLSADAFYKEMKVNIHLLKQKLISLNKHTSEPYLRARTTMTVLINNLNDILKNYASDYPSQVAEPPRGLVLAEMDKAKKVLAKHRGAKKVLGNIGLAIAGLGIFYLIAGKIHQKKSGHFLFFTKTDSVKKLTKIEKSILKAATP